MTYEDNVDRVQYEPNSPTEEEDNENEEENNIYEVKSKPKTKIKQIVKPKRNKKGITKSIKM